MTEKAREILDSVVKQISSETTSKFVSDRLFSDGADIPMRRWSILNQFVVHLGKTMDARGIRQWNEVGRKVVKGAKALYILVPIMVPRSKLKGKPNVQTKVPPLKCSSDEDEGPVLAGFKGMPVFRVEDTVGVPLPYQEKIRAFDPGTLPLIEVAGKLGVTVRAGFTTSFSGAYSSQNKEIILGTDNELTFLHELSHAVDDTLPGKSKDYAFNEVVAELSSCFLGSLYGIKVDIASTKAYIETYAGAAHVAFKVMEALSRVEKIYEVVAKHSKKAARGTRKKDTKASPPMPKVSTTNPTIARAKSKGKGKQQMLAIIAPQAAKRKAEADCASRIGNVIIPDLFAARSIPRGSKGGLLPGA